jgi:hypothetical protein
MGQTKGLGWVEPSRPAPSDEVSNFFEGAVLLPLSHRAQSGPMVHRPSCSC